MSMRPASVPIAPDPLDAVRRFIDDAILEQLTLADLARTAGLSTFHFTRQFTARFGLSPMAYVRTRRLSQAAGRLAYGPPQSLVELAFDSGFDSQEGFTRAFKRAFGVSPGRFARGDLPPPPEMTMTDAPALPPRLTQEPRPAAKPALRIVGLTRHFDDSTVSTIPALWDDFIGHMPIAGRDGEGTFGVCAMAPAGQGLAYAAGVPLKAGAAVPEGLDLIELPAMSYLVFRQILDGGDLHTQMQAAVKAIWGRLVPASGLKLAPAPELEVYPPNFQPGQKDGFVEWWIPVEI
jgi:AraC family transcriptional regulator